MSEKLTVMVSSTVYGVEELLERTYSLLTTFGYEVWMSHKGTMPVSSQKTAFENCLHAVKECDLFLGIITTQYGSGIKKSELSITHNEMKQAIERNKPRWILAHDHVVFARKLLRDLGYKTKIARDKLSLKPHATSISDLRIIDMYEDTIIDQLPLRQRKGNWVQKFKNDDDANLFVLSQFSRYQDVENSIKQNFSNPNQVLKKLKEKQDD